MTERKDIEVREKMRHVVCENGVVLERDSAIEAYRGMQ